MILQNEDRASIGHHVLYRKPYDPAGASPIPLVGRVVEILVHPESKALIGLLLVRCTIGAPVLPYRMPSCHSTGEHEFVTFQVSN